MNTQLTLAVFLLTLGSNALSATLCAEDWPYFRGPSNDGISAETIVARPWPTTGPTIAWRANVGIGFSGVTVVDGMLYTMGNEENQDTVYCLDVKTGRPIWTHQYVSATDPNEFEGGPTSTPTVFGDHVYSLGRHGDLFCFDRNDGDVIWSSNIADVADVRIPAWGFAGSPLVLGDRLILNVGDAGVAVNRLDGTLIWASTDKDAGYSTPVVQQNGDRTRVIIGSSRSYVCVDPESGDEIWRQRWLTTFGCNAADPLVVGNQVFLSSGYNRGAALFRPSDDGVETVWKNKELQTQLSTAIQLDGRAIGVHGDASDNPVLRCMDLKTGTLIWTEDKIQPGGLIATKNRIVVLTNSGELVVAERETDRFVRFCSSQVLEGKCWTAPVVANGRIYCRDASGQLACVVAN